MFFAQSEGATIDSTAGLFADFKAMVPAIKGDLGHFAPEILLSIGACVVILLDLFGSKEKSKSLGWTAIIFCLAALAAVLKDGFHPTSSTIFFDMLVVDGFGVFFKTLLLVGTIICVPMVMMHRGFLGLRMGEFYSLLLGSLVGMFLMVSSKNLLMFYLGIEFASITCYLLTAYQKENRPASEGGLKYVIYGSVASGLMIYGLSLIYGMTGSLDAAKIAGQWQIASSQGLPTLLIIASLLTLSGFAYKISAFPMHFWCPDVYEGAAIPFTAFLSVISKAAGFAVLIRFIWPFGGSGGNFVLSLTEGTSIHLDWPLILAVVSAITMTVGNLAALFQDNLKRLLAYSSIAHAGYLLMGLAALFPKTASGSYGWESIAFYLLVYLFMNLGAFLIVTIIANQTGRESIDAYRGLGARSKFLAVALFLILFSLIGLPPTAGFTGKLQLFLAAMNNGLVWLAVIAGMNTAISAWYYVRLIRTMFLESAESSETLPVAAGLKTFVVLLVFPIIYLFIFPSPTVEFIKGLKITLG